ncbi:DedA family protein [Seleniivibrio woodruffii]|uniref:Membrane protein DedA with SNARE-associated domain n=1 Tax=Seleniivibrio woodruffii TaxID=1078050 RepID=A0A4R1KES0_9BACT|nr:DedA family protein [Seleniivibrio woodruffii]TCK62600.1 membrane protein DedA with SNARE-associated domain [Seleniivibrio woodruffii]TVZ36974.1 membrane protein DedA with SNARE-associated domain [Seleniivibrio woodruffii]
MLDSFVQFVLNSVHDMGYLGIVFLMTLESSFVPFPSEVVVPPAGYLAAQGKMNIYLVVLSGVAGSILGALVNYYLAVFMGRALLEKYGKYLFMPVERLNKMDEYFKTHGEITTFVGRLLPAIRQYISFPAGLARMNMPKFIFFTSLGAGIWVVILAVLGYFVGNNIELIKSNLRPITVVTLCVLAVVVAVYIYWHKRRRKNAA